MGSTVNGILETIVHDVDRREYLYHTRILQSLHTKVLTKCETVSIFNSDVDDSTSIRVYLTDEDIPLALSMCTNYFGKLGEQDKLDVLTDIREKLNEELSS